MQAGSVASDLDPAKDRQQATVLKPRHRFIPKGTSTLGIVVLLIMYTFFILSTATILFGELIFMDHGFGSDNKYCDANYTHVVYKNPDYHQNPCRTTRYPFLFGLNLKECDYARRVLASVFLGGIIGFERKNADRPAGIRTMSLVSLGSCFFTISSMRAFESSTMRWDAARVSAAIPSGVGFLGACLIWKGSQGNGPNQAPAVHGLTTASSVWLSASIGVNAGGKMYVVAFYTAALVVIVLRLGPRLYFQEDDYSYGDDEDEVSTWEDYDYYDDTSQQLSEQTMNGYGSTNDIDDRKRLVGEEYFVAVKSS